MPIRLGQRGLDISEVYRKTSLGAQAFCMERKGPKSNSTNQGDRWKSEGATIAFWS